MRFASRLRPAFRARRRVVVALTLAAAALTCIAAVTSGAARAVVQTAPKNTAEPTISGNAVQGSTLNATKGDWTGTGTISYAFQWVRCPTSGGKPDGSDCATISGATTSAYVLGSGDVGKRLRVRVTASNAEGSVTAASNATATIASSGSGRPRNTSSPSISGNPTPGSTLQGDPGTWTGTQPITFAFRWARCDAGGNNCFTLPGQSGTTYVVQTGDVGRTLRIHVVASNASGSRSKDSGATAVVSSGLPPGGVKLPNGEVSIPATSVPSSERLVIDHVDFSPSPVRSLGTAITIHIKVKDTRGYDVRGALVFLRSTPLVTSTPAEQQTTDDGTVTYTVQPEADFPLRNGYNVQFFIKAHRQGDKPLAGIAGYRLVQVATAAS
jgi:hypothetical protein